MAIKIRCDSKIAMSEPFLNSLHRNIMSKKQARTGMTEVMETQMLQTISGNDVMEVLCHIPRREHIAVVVTTDKSVELLVVALSASLFELDFRFLLFKKHFLNVRNQRKSSSCGIGFQPGLIAIY